MKKEIITKELLSEVLGCKIDEVLPYNKDENFIEYTKMPISSDAGLWEDFNITELAIKIVDKMIALGYVASLTKVKEHWWCEFATENYYKNNGIMCYGNIDSKNDIDTKSDDVLSCAVKAYKWILEKQETK